MDGFSRWQKQLVLVAFTQAFRQAEFSQGPKKRLVAATVRDTIGYISQAFKAALRDDPKRDPDGSLSFLLESTFKGYANEDPVVKQPKSLPTTVLLKLLNLSQKELSTEMAELVCAAFFFAMKPCDYTNTLKTAKIKITNIITLGNIRFYRNNRILLYDQEIENENWVNITFEY